MKNNFFSNALKNIESVETYGILAIIVVRVDEYFRHPPCRQGVGKVSKCRKKSSILRFITPKH